MQRETTCAISVLAFAALSACDAEREINPDADVPAPARIASTMIADVQPLGGSGVSATVTFAELDDAMHVEADVSGMSGGAHGVYLGDAGSCPADTGSASAQEALNEASRRGPADPATASEGGHLGNLSAGEDGMAHMTLEVPDMTLIGDDGVFGKAVVVRGGAGGSASAAAGDEPAGSSGEALACGIIEWARAG